MQRPTQRERQFQISVCMVGWRCSIAFSISSSSNFPIQAHTEEAGKQEFTASYFLACQRALGLSFYGSETNAKFPMAPFIILEKTNYAMYAQALVMSRRARTKSLELPLVPWTSPRIFFQGRGVGKKARQDLTLVYSKRVYIYSNKSMRLAFEYCLVSNVTINFIKYHNDHSFDL